MQDNTTAVTVPLGFLDLSEEIELHKRKVNYNRNLQTCTLEKYTRHLKRIDDIVERFKTKPRRTITRSLTKKKKEAEERRKNYWIHQVSKKKENGERTTSEERGMTPTGKGPDGNQQ